MTQITAFRRDAKLGYSSASDVTKFLTSQRPFAHSFDIYLAQVSSNIGRAYHFCVANGTIHDRKAFLLS